ncbi:MAG: DUF3426 domain-containing protein [Anaerolineae bacterium]|nr:DUF3426 domain-containing protein [Anaerolineae bacterium]
MRGNIIKQWLGILTAGLVLTGCVIEEQTPSLVDPTNFATYQHPTGTYTLEMPPDWVVNDQSDAFAVSTEFSPPDTSEPLLNVYIVSLSTLPGTSSPESIDLDTLVAAYEGQFYAASDAVTKEQSRDIQPDGSLRIKLVVDSPQGTSQHNDFLQIVEPYLAVLRVRLPDDQTQMRTVSHVINTFAVNNSVGWASVLQQADSQYQDAVGFASLNAWVDRNGGFVVAGQVVNNAANALEFVRIEARLYDAENRLLLSQDDFVSSDTLLPGEYAPFSLIFSDGLPSGTVRYDLNASARYADIMNRNFYGPENFAVSSTADFDANGFLVVSGQVRNEGVTTANLVKAIAVVFDEQGRVIATDTTLTDVQQLPPGQTSTFSVSFAELGGVPNTFVVSAQGVAEE